MTTYVSPGVTKTSPNCGNVRRESVYVRKLSGRSLPDFHEEWHRLIDEKLIPWGIGKYDFDIEEQSPPTPIALDRACKFALHMKKTDFPAPTSLIADINGGVVFEIRRGDFVERLQIWEDGEAELLHLKNGQVTMRRLISFSPST